MSVKGLRVAIHNEKVLIRIKNIIGFYVRPDHTALKHKAVVQYIRVIHDVQQRAQSQRAFFVSPVLSVELGLMYVKCKGICKSRGFFGHGAGCCDKALD